MLYHLFYPLKESWSILNILRYITFRSASAAIFALLISFLIGPWIIHKLKHLQIGENIRSTGPKSHLKKKGTPTMGGVLILCAVLLPTFLFAKLDNVYIQIIFLSTIWMGLIGFLDDYLKIIKKIEKGLIARYKLAGQILLGSAVSIWIYTSPEFTEIRTITSIPFLKSSIFDFGILYPAVIILVITGTSNAVNLTDGLDGLASGLLAIAFTVFAAITYISGRVDYSEYLNILYLPGIGELSVFASAMAGACLGFLWFNAPPAKIFMGDTGSLALGGSLGAVGIITKHEIVLAITGGLFVLETVSVIVQVLSYKLTGKRVFKMAPIHHHFEKKGWAESTVVVRFWIISIILAMIGLATLKLR